jgi:hypothetical protein
MAASHNAALGPALLQSREPAPPEPDWKSFIGQQVQIHRSGGFIRAGYVDDVADSGDVIWLGGHGIDPRRLFMKADGFTVTVLRGSAGKQLEEPKRFPIR